jgi:hypothetical protein
MYTRANRTTGANRLTRKRGINLGGYISDYSCNERTSKGKQVLYQNIKINVNAIKRERRQ